MNRQLLKQFMLCLKTNLRKIRFLPLFVVLLAFVPQAGSAIDFTYSLENGNILRCSVTVVPFRTESILNSMELGHRTQISYTVKVYENRSRLFGIFGDRLAGSATSTYIATWDPIRDIYNITDSNGEKTAENDAFSFFTTFFSSEAMSVNMNRAGRGKYYITGRVEMKIIKLMPPLNLFSNIIPGIIEKTDWITLGEFRIR